MEPQPTVGALSQTQRKEGIMISKKDLRQAAYNQMLFSVDSNWFAAGTKHGGKRLRSQRESEARMLGRC